ncbi:MAG: MFS transporter, partial [Chloroflexi bacterium]|nr:MFS transporter [Chloroflexota bacterium]
AIVGAAFLLKPDTGVKKLAFDLRGAGYFGMSLVALMTGFTTLGGKGSEISWSVAPISIAIGFALLIMFVRHERRTQAPLIDPQLFHGRPFMAANAFNLLFGFTTGALVLLPLYAISVYGASTVQSGIAVTPRSAAMMAASIVTSFMIMRWGYRKPMLCGVALMVLAATFLALEFQSVSIPGVTISGMAIMLVVVGLSGLGHGIISPAANNACIELMPDRVSTITGLRQTIRNVGHALGIASATIVLENSASLSRGFSFVFGGIAIVAVSTLPFILAMPRSPSDFKSRGTELRK